MAAAEQSPWMSRLPLVIMAALAVWGLVHAIGAYLYNYNPLRGLVVGAAMALFIAWWAWLLRLHARRQREGSGQGDR